MPSTVAKGVEKDEVKNIFSYLICNSHILYKYSPSSIFYRIISTINTYLNTNYTLTTNHFNATSTSEWCLSVLHALWPALLSSIPVNINHKEPSLKVHLWLFKRSLQYGYWCGIMASIWNVSGGCLYYIWRILSFIMYFSSYQSSQSKFIQKVLILFQKSFNSPST